MTIDEIEKILEAILFASGEPIALKRLAATVSYDIETVAKILGAMADKYSDRGFCVRKIEDSYQLVTNPKYAEYVAACLNIEKKQPLSQTLLETLSIIAYMQPVTKQQIMDIRGADAKHAVNKLMDKGLVCEMGRSDVPGRPLLFGTTDEFLRRFGFSSIAEMPSSMRKVEEQMTVD